MKTFILVIIVLLALETLSNMWYSMHGDYTPTTPTVRFISAAISLGLVGWGLWLLA